MHIERRWVPRKTGVPPSLPPAMQGGYWVEEYVETPQEAAERGRKEKAAAERDATADMELRGAGSVAEIAQVLAKYPASSFSSEACRDAWSVLTASQAVAPTHDLVNWKSRSREWGFYFRWLPDTVVREADRQPLWKVPGREAWISAQGGRYQLVPDYEGVPLDRVAVVERTVVLERGERFATLTRESYPGGRPTYYLGAGRPVKTVSWVIADDLKRFVGAPSAETNDNDRRRRARIAELERRPQLSEAEQADLRLLRDIEGRRSAG